MSEWPEPAESVYRARVPSPPPLSRPRAYVLLHGTIVVWGFTAILGKLISTNAYAIVWYRQWIAALVLVLATLRANVRLPLRDVARLAGIAAIVTAHWLCFYGSIKVSGVAVAVVCLATTSFFVSLIEPLVFKRRIRLSESALGLVVLMGVVLLVRGEAHADPLGIVLGIGAAFAAATFGTINGALVQRLSPITVSLYELSFGAAWMTLVLLVVPGAFVSPAALSMADAMYLGILGVFCTALPWLTSLRALHTLSPFTVALSLNLEPVYSLIIAWFVFPGSERLTIEFYVGTAVLIGAVALNEMRRSPSKNA